MNNLAPAHSVSTDPKHQELHFSISGLWSTEQISDFLRDLDRASVPFMMEHQRVNVFGNMDGFVTQTRETGEVIRDHLQSSARH